MKNRIFISVFTFLLISNFGYSQYNDDYEKLGLPGDNLNLYATLKLFQESETLELFERKLNSEDSKINNLDLNGDNQIDYIKVIDNVENNVHVITLQVAINQSENQDVAVIVVQNDNNKVQIQVIGDENLYGKDYIIEPNLVDVNGRANEETPNPGYMGHNPNNRGTTVIVNNYTTSDLYGWPIVRYIYAPRYNLWHSPWYWDYYPSYWHSWSPYYWHYYWGFHYHWHDYYHGNYRHWHQNRYSGWNTYYGHRRANSIIVKTKIQNRNYSNTYSRPDMAEKGSDSFKKQHPESAYSKRSLPDVKNLENKNNTINRNNNNYKNIEKRSENQDNNYINKRNNNQIDKKTNNNNSTRPESRNSNSNYSNPQTERRNYSKPENIKKTPNYNQSTPNYIKRTEPANRIVPPASKPIDNKKEKTNPNKRN